MGGQISTDLSQEFQNKLQFIQTAQDKNFGRIEIFRSKQIPYEYIMKFDKAFLEKDHNYLNYSGLMQKLKQRPHKNIVKLHFTEDKQEKLMCLKNYKLCTYLNYYNYTLQNAIDKKKSKGLIFHQNQVWYIFTTLLSIGKYLKNDNISLGDYTTSKLFLTPEGFIKIYLLDFSQQNKHNSYFAAMSSKQQLENHLLSPQQLYGIQNNIEEIKFDVYKSDVFSIAMIVLQLISLDDPKCYYNLEVYKVNFERIQYNLAIIKNQYSKSFQFLLKSCLQSNHHKRFSFQEAINFIDKINPNILISDSIKLIDEEQYDIKKKTSNETKKTQNDQKAISERMDKSLLVPIPENNYDHSLVYGNRVTSLRNLNNNMMQSRTSASSYEKKNKQIFK